MTRRRTRSRRRSRSSLALVVLLVAALVAWRADGHSGTTAVAQLPATEPPAAGTDRVIVEPDAGMQPVYALLASAHRTLDMTMYELADPTAESLLADDAARGVRVRVLLDGRLERSHNTSAYDFLRSRGVDVAWSSRRFFVTHEKTFVVDDRTAVVMSLNLTTRYYATTRDVAVVDGDPRDVAAVESVFAADLRGASTGTPAADDLVWSPHQSGADIVALIRSARRSIAVESEELSDPASVTALVAAARRGVDVTLAMTYQSDWVPAFNRLVAAGGHVGVLHGESPLYIHAKILVVDAGTPRGRAFVGSQNLSTTSLQDDRELGIVLVAPLQVHRLAGLVAHDASLGEPWR